MNFKPLAKYLTQLEENRDLKIRKAKYAACRHHSFTDTYFDLHYGDAPYFRAKHVCNKCGMPHHSATLIPLDDPTFRHLMLKWLDPKIELK